MTQRFIGIKDHLEFHDVMRNTATAGAYDVLTKFVGMCKIFFVYGRDVGSWQRPLLLLYL